jgi:hypothetical protein
MVQIWSVLWSVLAMLNLTKSPVRVLMVADFGNEEGQRSPVKVSLAESKRA